MFFSLVRYGTNASNGSGLVMNQDKESKRLSRVRIETLTYQLDGSVLDYRGIYGYVELGFDSGEGA